MLLHLPRTTTLVRLMPCVAMALLTCCVSGCGFFINTDTTTSLVSSAIAAAYDSTSVVLTATVAA